MAQHGKAEVSPPLILAIENSSPCGSLALVCPELCLAEYSLTTTISHSRRLLTAIEQIMAQTATDWPQLDAIAVSAGPGSFTGLRIGLATAKAMAMATAKPLIAVSSTTTLASQLPWTERLICPVIDARKGEVYSALYRAERDGAPRRVSAIAALRPEDLARRIAEPVILVGDGIRSYRQVLADCLGEWAAFADPGLFFPRAAALGRLALEKYRRRDFLDPATGVPEYIRPSEAELLFASPSAG